VYLPQMHLRAFAAFSFRASKMPHVSHSRSSLMGMWRVGNSPQPCKCCVSVGEREAVRAPRFRIWVDLRRLNNSTAYLKSVSTADANDLKCGGVLTALPNLLINRKIAFAMNLPVRESAAPKSSWQRLIGMAFLTLTLTRSARFPRREG